MSESLQKQPEEKSDLAVFDKWYQKLAPYVPLLTGVGLVIFNQIYLALLFFGIAAVIIGYGFVKRLREEDHQVLELEIPDKPILSPTLEEPTFTEGYDVIKFTVGSNDLNIDVALLENTKRPFPFGGIPVTVYVEENKPYADVDIYDVLFEIPVRLRHNKLMNRPENWDMNSDKTALEVVNEKGQPVFQLYYKTPSHVVINGLLLIGKSTILATDGGTIMNPYNIDPYPLKPMFKYPSSKYRGRRV